MGRKSGKRWSSRFTETWRSALSWMHWRRRAREKALRQVEMLLIEQRHVLQMELRTLLLEAMRPMAEAMQRQDKLLELRTDAIEHRMLLDREEVTELLMEVLQTVQPKDPVGTALGLPPGPSKPPPSFPGSAISATR